MLAVTATDIVSKRLAVSWLVPHSLPRDVAGDWLRLTLVYNRGAAFGLNVGEYSRWIFMGLTLVAELSMAAVQLMLGVDAPVSTLVIRDIAMKSIYAFFLGIPVYIGIRRLLRPALIEDRAVRSRTQPRMIGA